MIKAVIFDFGGVLMRTEDQTPRRRWEKQIGLQAGELEALVLNSESGHQAQRGEMTEEAMWKLVGQQLDLTEHLDVFRRDFWAGDVLDEALIDYLRRLLSTYQTALISNAMDGLRADLERKLHITDAFDLIVISAEEGMLKPDAEIYERTLARLGRRPDEAVFIDDAQPNIAGARAVGMHAIHFDGQTDIVAALADLGVMPKE